MSETVVNDHQWKMVIDLDTCTGCQACVVACHAENNVPTVGAEEVSMGRSRHWIRIERYWDGEYPDVKARFMPVMCQQCGHAPCEPVCPTFATYHSDVQDINVQVYNRCIGTRYCANNCPYSARILDWFDPYFPDPMQEQLNPDVTVRSRGVMEKCTFCIQRIHYGEEQARKEDRPMDDSDMVPACAQSCPTRAITFGDLNNPNSAIHALMESPRAIKLLNEQGTDPAVIYLKGGDSNVG